MIISWFSKVTKRAMVQAAVLLIIPVACSKALAACSDLSDKTGSRSNVNYQKAMIGRPLSGDNVAIGPTTYHSETQGFERPWPFGPDGEWAGECFEPAIGELGWRGIASNYPEGIQDQRSTCSAGAGC
jgi:hypothetical protein